MHPREPSRVRRVWSVSQYRVLPSYPERTGRTRRVVRCPNGQAGEYFGRGHKDHPRGVHPSCCRPSLGQVHGRPEHRTRSVTPRRTSRQDPTATAARPRGDVRRAHGRRRGRGILARRGRAPGWRSPSSRCARSRSRSLMAHLTRPIIRDVQRLEDDRARLLDLYGRARQDSLLDGLTGLGNHRAFQEELRRQLEHATRHKSPLSLLLIDVDDLKKVNDEHGHATGDELLSAVGRIAMSALRRGDRAFRVGGDEFAVVLPNADVETGLTVARRMLAGALNGAFTGNTRRAVLAVDRHLGLPGTEHAWATCSTATPTPPCTGASATAARTPSPTTRAVTASTPTTARSRTSRRRSGTILAEKSLRPGLPADLLADDRRADRLRGPHPPDRRARRWPMPAASSPPPSVPTGRSSWTWPASRWSPSGVNGLEPGMYLSVNLSPRTLESDLFHPVELTAIFDRRGIAPEQLVIELTEREEVQDLQQLRRNAAACRRAGMRLAADDVGAGNAGLRLLSRDPLRHRQDRPVAGAGRDPARPVARRPARPPGARRPLERDDRRRGRRDRRAAGRRPRAGHHRRPGLPARPTGPRAPRGGARPRLADARDAACRTAVCAWSASPAA